MTDTTYRTVTPYLLVNDADAELRFLEAAFAGIVSHCSRTPEGRVMHAEVTIGDSLVMLGQCGPEWPAKPCGHLHHLYYFEQPKCATFEIN